ncbi:PAS domain S-box protein [Novosphingobium mangrovi (ex Huang et al. 2023)]|uniref:histidine kinase n=1 Tax=Novosphingobium mangrovi (ex Huang et al. 2023) TaxID=2976432 RepID=A0ABT2IA39_9SPHN|nr:PAS domain S-box protein [Novosphingobium mangrovi (ex Huang et al. 2023)]MCT2401692.1 PAS domain S-box protein [Novosphingobium mangrovi (ex Huang et al. 2023)]
MNRDDPKADPAALLAAIVESTDDAIVGKTLDGRILSWNTAAERIFGWSAEEIVGINVRTLIPIDRLEEEDAIIAAISRGERVPTFETVRLHKDGDEISLAVTVSPVLDDTGAVIAASKIARDITDNLALRAQLEESERRFRLMADNISQIAWIADRQGQVIWGNRRWPEFTGMSVERALAGNWRDVHHPDHIDRFMTRRRASLESGEDWEDTYPMRGKDGRYRWFLSRAVAIRDDAGNVACWFGTSTDVTEMREAEERIELLLQEVNHRSKNMLAIVQSLARRADADGPDFIERLERRISGLAANQDVLVRRAWSRIPVLEMIEAQLRSLGDARSQIACEGPQVLLSPGAAESLAMAFHEMATNAVKYGALSVPEGRVAVRWSLDGEGREARFRIEWIESDGPPAHEPERQGFGTRIIVDVPRVKLNARLSIEYLPEGFRWGLECAADAIS